MENLKVVELIQLLEVLPDQGYLIKLHLRDKASIKELIAALQTSTIPDIREILCDVLGDMYAEKAVPALIKCLDDPISNVRSAAADALSKIRSPLAGESLIKHFAEQEKDMEVRRMIALALGAVNYLPAIPILIEALTDSDASLRGSVAWSLGVLNAKEAIGFLETALTREKNSYASRNMKEALDTLKKPELN